MCYRVRREENRTSIIKFFNSVNNLFTDKNKIEFLVKLDVDDKEGIEIVNNLNYPFEIRPFITRRWEGRWTMNYFYEYLFVYKAPESKFISFVGDDIWFIRNIMEDIKKNLNKRYYILGDFKEEMTTDKLKLAGSYRETNWLSPRYICSYPIVSSKIIEIIGNFGYQPNMDGHLTLLGLILYQKYKINIFKHIPEFIIRNNIDRIENFGGEFNQDNLITDDKLPVNNDYFFQLIEQQAKNIYLNKREL